MSKLNLITIVAIVAAVSLIVGITSPVFAQGNTTKGNATNPTMKAFQAAGGAANSTNPLGNAANTSAVNTTK